MNLFTFLSHIEKADTGLPALPNNRRAAFRYLAGFGKKAALAAVPLGLSGLFSRAHGQGSASVAAVLNQALKLEHLQAEFYKAALAAPGLVFPAGVRAAIELIRDHQLAHINLLRDRIFSLNVTPNTYTAASFDFVTSGAFSDYNTFLNVAQVLEDTGLRAYKGKLTKVVGNKLAGNKEVLRLVLAIHSVEARHAAHIRQLRSTAGVTGLKPWITGNNDNGTDANAYAGEEKTTQAGTDITTLAGIGGNLSASAASEAFDEPLPPAVVEAIIAPFMV